MSCNDHTLPSASNVTRWTGLPGDSAGSSFSKKPCTTTLSVPSPTVSLSAVGSGASEAGSITRLARTSAGRMSPANSSVSTCPVGASSAAIVSGPSPRV